MAANRSKMRGLCGLRSANSSNFGLHSSCRPQTDRRNFSTREDTHMVAEVAQRLVLAPPVPDATGIALFVDLDGTVFEFAPTPDSVTVDAQLPAVLRRLSTTLDGALAVISGRPLAAIDALLQWPQLIAAGQHGAELRHANGQIDHASINMAALDAARTLLHTRPPRADDVRIEDKDIALAIHYREFPGAEPFA